MFGIPEAFHGSVSLAAHAAIAQNEAGAVKTMLRN
jgi:hypothetical protein